MARWVVNALRAVLAVMFLGTVGMQVGMLWLLISGNDPEDGTLPLTAFRICAIVGLLAVQVALVCVWRLVSMVRRGTVFSPAAFRFVDGVIGAVVAVAIVWFVVTAINAPGQREDPGVTLIMAGIGVAVLGVALVIYVLRLLLAQAVARDAEASRMQAELDEVI
ncbi:DUF2975 domain-containing protein [Nakamurella sp. YIM 132087]|uniref:DUF2975 domain-containing protein n=1 Tax=Nakamurella alba TaxID=2665158 RepID=A0A7K1FM10_9ACTN|nr:DUF2975 domain-containing protein [Nakamurella alba]MTD13924.1 DUF2975 domain-containing protein [Nakamurella alba]